jgi:mRNA interferase HigB
MKVVGLKTLDKFKRKHGDCSAQIDEWLKDVRNSNWQSFNDVKKAYPSASVLNGNTVIFNIKWNNYRLVTVVVIVAGSVFIEWIGTHEECNGKTF